MVCRTFPVAAECEVNHDSVADKTPGHTCGRGDDHDHIVADQSVASRRQCGGSLLGNRVRDCRWLYVVHDPRSAGRRTLPVVGWTHNDLGASAFIVFALARSGPRRRPPLQSHARSPRTTFLVGESAHSVPVAGRHPVDRLHADSGCDVQSIDNTARLLEFTGVCLWCVGLFFEAVGDWQMARFQADPNNSGQVMDRGLWRLTRHPNYFGDFCIWWGLYLIAAPGGAGWTVLSPLLMSFFLLKVSGVTLLEKTITTRRPDYAAYQARTSAFFPWWPKS